MAGDVAPGPAHGLACQAQQVQHQLADQLHQVHEVVQRVQHLRAQPVQQAGQRGALALRARGGEFLHALQHVAVGLAHGDVLRPALAPLVPQQLRADVVQPLQARQVPGLLAVRATQLGGDAAPGAPVGKGGRHPVAAHEHALGALALQGGQSQAGHGAPVLHIPPTDSPGREKTYKSPCRAHA